MTRSNLFIRDAVSHVLQVAADVVHVGVAEEDPGKVLLTDGREASGVGEELNLQHLCLQVVHEPAQERRRQRKWKRKRKWKRRRRRGDKEGSRWRMRRRRMERRRGEGEGRRKRKRRHFSLS